MSYVENVILIRFRCSCGESITTCCTDQGNLNLDCLGCNESYQHINQISEFATIQKVEIPADCLMSLVNISSEIDDFASSEDDNKRRFISFKINQIRNKAKIS